MHLWKHILWPIKFTVPKVHQEIEAILETNRHDVASNSESNDEQFEELTGHDVDNRSKET